MEYVVRYHYCLEDYIQQTPIFISLLFFLHLLKLILLKSSHIFIPFFNIKVALLSSHYSVIKSYIFIKYLNGQQPSVEFQVVYPLLEQGKREQVGFKL